MTCTVSECDKPARCKEMCMGHYRQMKRHGAVKTLQLRETMDPKERLLTAVYDVANIDHGTKEWGQAWKRLMAYFARYKAVARPGRPRKNQS